MEGEFLLNFKDLTLEAIIMAFVVFITTMLVKWPIKKFTAKLDENKRKAVNTVIVFIPMLLALIYSVLYFGIFKKEWFSTKAFEITGSAYILAVFIYALYSRVIILVKGVKKESKEGDSLGKEAIKFIKKNINAVSKTLRVDEQKLESVVTKIQDLLVAKDKINENVMMQDITAIEKLNKEISQLQKQEQLLRSSIESQKEEMTVYQNSLAKKGE